MPFRDSTSTTQDKIAAYQLAIESLPRPELWYAALGSRNDGSTPAGIFAALDGLRMELQVRIGDLACAQNQPQERGSSDDK